MSKLIHVRQGGIVAIAAGPSAEGQRPTTALHVQGFDLPHDLTDAEVRLAPDEVARLVRELLQRMPPSDRRDLVAGLATE
jgi:hypothetical protein